MEGRCEKSRSMKRVTPVLITRLLSLPLRYQGVCVYYNEIDRPNDRSCVFLPRSLSIFCCCLILVTFRVNLVYLSNKRKKKTVWYRWESVQCEGEHQCSVKLVTDNRHHQTEHLRQQLALYLLTSLHCSVVAVGKNLGRHTRSFF
jgi:hypothetical protein